MDIADSSIFITGAAQRIGAQIAKTLAARRAKHLLIHYHQSHSRAMSLTKELKKLGAKKISLIQDDLSRGSGVKRISQNVARLEPDLNAVVFNAGLWEKTPFGQVSEQDWDSHMNVNLKSSFFIAQDLGLKMKKRGAGHIIFISDWSGLKPYTHYIPYCLSKTGLLYLTQALARALAPQVQVNAILPGAALPQPKTSAQDLEKMKKASLLKRLGSSDSVARAVRFFLEEADFTTGAWFPVDGGRFIA